MINRILRSLLISLMVFPMSNSFGSDNTVRENLNNNTERTQATNFTSVQPSVNVSNSINHSNSRSSGENSTRKWEIWKDWGDVSLNNDIRWDMVEENRTVKRGGEKAKV